MRICLLMVMGVLLVSPVQGAVQGGREGERIAARDLAPYLAPRIRYMDAPLIAQELKLDDERRVILDQIVLDYLQFVERETTAVIERVASAAPYEVSADAAAVRRDELRLELRSALDEDVEPSEFERVVRDSMVSELSVGSQPSLMASARSQALASWDSMHEDQWAVLVQSVDSIRDQKEPGHWDAVFRALRRRNSPWRPMVYGEGLDLARIVYDVWGRDSAVASDCYQVLLEYAVEYDDALRLRDGLIRRIRPVQQDARVMGVPGAWIDGARREAEARAELAMVNERYVDAIARCMPESDAVSFSLLANRAMYPEVFRPTAFQRLYRHLQDHAGALGILPEQLRAIERINEAYKESFEPLRAQWLESARRSEPEAIVLDAETEAMLRCYGYMGPLDPAREEVVGMTNVIRDRIDGLDELSTQKVLQAVGPEVFARVPAAAYQPELVSGFRSPLRGDAGDFRVVYLRNAGDQAGLDKGNYDRP